LSNPEFYSKNLPKKLAKALNLLILLDNYADDGIVTIEASNVLRVQPLSGFDNPVDTVRLFGGKEQFDQAIPELDSQLYATAS